MASTVDVDAELDMISAVLDKTFPVNEVEDEQMQSLLRLLAEGN